MRCSSCLSVSKSRRYFFHGLLKIDASDSSGRICLCCGYDDDARLGYLSTGGMIARRKHHSHKRQALNASCSHGNVPSIASTSTTIRCAGNEIEKFGSHDKNSITAYRYHSGRRVALIAVPSGSHLAYYRVSVQVKFCDQAKSSQRQNRLGGSRWYPG